jgi:zinc resistance-associated protein
MTKISIKKLITFGTILLVTGFTAYAFAYGGGYHMGDGYGYGMMNGYGYNHMDGYHHMGSGHMWNNLSVEDQQKMQDQMNAFFSSTQELRTQYDQKRVELNTEYSKSNKDQAKIDALEKDLFDLSSKIEQERFDHTRKMRELFADEATGFNYGMGGYGYGGCF